MSNQYAIIKHQIFKEISDDDVLKFLPKSDFTPKYKIFDIKREIIPMDQVHRLDSFEFRIFQKNIVENEIKPFLQTYPECKLVYFGTATIPLALHLGYCFGGWQDVNVYLLNREKMDWDFANHDRQEDLPTLSNFIKEEFIGPIEVIYKVESTYLMQNEELKAAVDSPSKIIGLRLETIGKDVFKNESQLKSFAHQFALGIDSIANYLPNADKIHLFPTVPVGLAFLIGSRINPLVTKPIVTYQYDTNHDPKYQPILILQEAAQPEINISDEDRSFIDKIKHELKQEVEYKIPQFIQSKGSQNENSWLKFIMIGDFPEMLKGYWKNIPVIRETVLMSSKVEFETNLAAEGFHVSEGNGWQINDRFIYNISKRLEFNTVHVLRAMRLFIFHEALHIYQRLTNYTASNIGRFPRVLEEADYIADVWAMLHELSYSQQFYSEEIKDLKSFFASIMNTAISTMWAFDDLDPNNDEMQIRRLNRYLIWYWNFLQIEDRDCDNLERVVEILAVKPLLEIKGLDIRAQSQRTIFRLTNFRVEELEIGYLPPSGKIIRASNSAGLQIDNLIRGFRERNGEIIRRQLKSLYDQVRGI